ncbi:DUF2167 domain-containing protein, partial [Shewanella sp. A3A]|nr:DUF2167 domain-containing protein [Shewanella ferrihydritica]
LLSAGLVFAQEAPKPEESPSPEQLEAAYEAEDQEMVKALNYQESSAELPGGMAKLNLPAGYRYMDPKEARTVVVDLWGNPPQSATDILGMIV